MERRRSDELIEPVPASRRTRVAAIAVAIGVLVVAGGWLALRERAGVERGNLVVERPDAVLDSELVVPAGVDADSPAPAVIVAHGLGGAREDVAWAVSALARAGYVVLAPDARGFGGSSGEVGIAGPDAEVADLAALVAALAERPEVELDATNDPRVAIVGVSYGGGLALLAAAADDRVDATVPIFAWYDLVEALEPAGVLKLRWASELFAAGSLEARSADPCGRIDRALCRAWTDSARVGELTPAARAALDARSPAASPRALDVPTLIVQGQMDSLFDLHQATALAQQLRRNRAAVRVEWVRGGHDEAMSRPSREHVEGAVVAWLDRHLRERGHVDAGPRFTVELGAGRGYAHAPRIPPVASVERLELRPAEHTDRGDAIPVAIPPAGLPAEVTTLPGYGNLTQSVAGFPTPPGQLATFTTDAVERGLEVVGTPVVQLAFTGEHDTIDAFVRLVDLAPDGRRIVTRGLVAAVRVEQVPPRSARRGRVVEVELPPIAWRLAPGHRFAVEVASTDAGYVAPRRPGTFAVALAGDRVLDLPIVDASDRSPDAFDSSRDWRDLLWLSLVVLLGAIATAGILLRRGARVRARVQEPHLRDVPLAAVGLTKRFDGDRLVVDSLDLRVEPGTVVGLIGPNGAGKTTALRMLLGLVRPTAGTAHLFGQRVVAGSAHLQRVGAMVDGPGLVPHLTGRQHLARYWSAAGHGSDPAEVERVLAAVDLLDDADRVVRTWSQGMRQRLGIAQALLGDPPLVVLDEPANGLDPAQIARLRDLVRLLVAEGRSVLLSSHLLGELEQVCTHAVLLLDGRVLEAGTLAEVVGEHGSLEAAFLALVEQARAIRPGGDDDA